MLGVARRLFRGVLWVYLCLALGQTEENTLHVDITISGKQERVHFAPHTDVQALAKRVRLSLPHDAISGECTADCIEARLAEAMRIETSAALLDLPARPRRRPLHVALDAVAANLTAHGEREYGAFVSALGAWPWAHERKSSLGDSLRRLAPARRADTFPTNIGNYKATPKACKDVEAVGRARSARSSATLSL